MEEKEKEELKKVIVAVFTPYLTENMADEYTEEYIQMQKEKYGYEQDNLNGETFLFTPKYRVKIDSHDDHESDGPDQVLLGIHGSTEAAEDMVRQFRGSGLVMARFSIFYGGPSRYTGNYPEDSGYAIDLPKDVATVRKLLTTDDVLDALVEREEAKIKGAIEELNKGLERPVLVTPYLAKALRYER